MTHPHLETTDATSIEPGIVSAHRFPTYAHLVPGISDDRVARAFAAELVSLQERGNTRVQSFMHSAVPGAGIWRQADWETGHLGFRCARLDHLLCSDAAPSDARADWLSRMKDEWRARGYRYIVTRIDSADIQTLHALEQTGFLTLDLINLLLRDVGPDVERPVVAPAVSIGSATEADLFHLTRIARLSFREDRFHNDPLIADATADAMHADWIHNQVVNGLAEEVLVARVDGTPVGFVSMVTNRDAGQHLGARVGTIVLLAVDRSVRGQGLGKTLTQAALAWFGRNGVTKAQVGTQAWNLPAVRTYLAAGFKPARSYTTLRLYLR